MQIVLSILMIQALIGAFDNIWHHEIKEKLTKKKSARSELALHSMREFLYAIIFIFIAWFECRGYWGLLLALIFVIEIMLTLMDFVVEDATRGLPKLERIIHTVLAINFGVFLALFTPILWQWIHMPSELTAVSYAYFSHIFTVFSIGVFLWGVYDMLAVIRLGREPSWIREPIIAGSKARPRKILITGATGFIGRSLLRKFIENGDQVIALSRSIDKANDLFGPHVRVINSLASLSNDTEINAIISLAGASVAGGFWTKKRKRLLLESRVSDLKAIEVLVQRLEQKPKVLVNASAVGFYGVCGDEELTEESKGQDIFQSLLCQQKEQAANRLKKYHVRVCNLRIGLVFDPNGGAFPAMIRPICFGLGAVFAKGRQWISWIYKADLIRLILFCLSQEHLDGAINATTPYPIRNKEFTYQVANYFNKPVFFVVPASLLKIGLGELSQLFLCGQKVRPEKALASGFRFNQATFSQFLSVMDKAKDEKEGQLNVFYNDDCPICRTEIRHYKGILAERDDQICFHDVNKHCSLALSFGLKKEEMKRRLYLRDPKGRMISGIDAFILIWGRLPYYHHLANFFKLPFIHGLGELIYDQICVPILVWLNHRREIQ